MTSVDKPSNYYLLEMEVRRAEDKGNFVSIECEAAIFIFYFTRSAQCDFVATPTFSLNLIVFIPEKLQIIAQIPSKKLK